MDKTVLHDEHIKLGARMVSFAGWQMPVQYNSIIEEHKCVRKNAGIFDVSHMGQVFVSGNDTINFLQKIVPQDISTFKLNRAHYCQLTNERGGIIDDLIIYRLTDKYLIILNASRIEADMTWLKKNAQGFDVTIDNASNRLSMIALQGPNASKVLACAGIKEENQGEFFSAQKTKLFDAPIYLCRSGYTGEDGFEIIMQNESAPVIWQKLLDEGKNYNVMPIGLGARDTLRLEAALCLYGADIDEDITPIEAQLGWSVPLDKKEDYNGREIILGQKTKQIPLRKMLLAYEMQDRAIARHGDEVFIEGKKCGQVTSGSFSPILGKNIGLFAVSYDKECSDLATSLNTREKSIGTMVQIMVRNKLYNAKIVKKPFVEKKYKK